MANQKDITLRPGEASPNDVVLHAQPVADLAAQVTIYLSALDASPANVVLRDPATQPAAGGDVTGTLAATEGSDTVSISGSVLVVGTLAATESGSDSAALAGGVRVSGALAVAESGSDIAALAGVVPVAGTLAAAESAADAAAFAGLVRVAGALAAAEAGGDVVALAGAVAVAGTLSVAESGADVAALSGSVPVVGTLAIVEVGSDTAAWSGTVSGAAGGVIGLIAVAESGADVAALSGSVTGDIAVPPAPTSGAGGSGRLLRKKPRRIVADWWTPLPLTEPAPIEDEEALHLLGMI